MILIKTKKEQVIIDERNVTTVEYNKNCDDVWIRIPKPDGNYDKIVYEKVLAVEYHPNTEQFTLTKNDKKNATKQ